MSTQRNEDAVTADSEQRVEIWKAIPGFDKYEASDLGRVRNTGTGKVLKPKVGTHGYLEVGPYQDGRQRFRPVHSLVLVTFAGPRPEGQETLHGPGGPHDNRWPENLRWGTKPENHADQRTAGTAKTPAVHFCVNHERCGGMAARQGSRCLSCVTEVGKQAGAMLGAGMGLETVTGRLGYSNADWVLKLARQFGGYAGTAAEARGQGRRWAFRLLATVRYRTRRAMGDGT